MSKKYLVPTHIAPSREAFERLGWQFRPVLTSPPSYEATLPPGWSIKVESKDWSTFYDQDKHLRGNIFYGEEVISLIGRYSIADGLKDEKTGECVVYVADVMKRQLIFQAGSTKLDANSDEHAQLVAKAKAYLDQYYPQWHDTLAYWED